MNLDNLQQVLFFVLMGIVIYYQAYVIREVFRFNKQARKDLDRIIQHLDELERDE